jgi:iron(III) transport system permease protein
MLLMSLMGLGLLIERWQRGPKRYAIDTAEGLMSLRKLGGWMGWATLGLCLFPLAFGFVLPGARLVGWAWTSLETAEWNGLAEAAWHSFSLATGAMLLVVSTAFLLVSGYRAFGCRSVMIAQKIALAGYGFPSALVAVGVGATVLWLSRKVPGAAFMALSASVCGLMAAYWVRFLAVGIQPLGAGFERLPTNLREAARVLGETPLGALRRVDVPLLWPAIAAAAALCFIDVFKELTLTLVLRPFDFETMATRIYRFTDEGRIAEASLPGLGLVILSLAGLFPLLKWMGARDS